MKIYFDAEFTDLLGIVCDIKLISLGFVAEDGREFYAEFTDNYLLGECSSFVHEAVLPHLDNIKYGMSVSEFRLKFMAWIQSFVEPVELYSDAVGYDFGLLSDLYADHLANWPSNLLRKPVSANSHEVQQGIETYFQYQPLATRHHALWDARALAFSVNGFETGSRF